jgi:23S rRNA G2069 N7-methylase RlmK/C1962 C5-methylase RlmI
VLARFAERGRQFDLIALDPPAFASAAARGGKPWSAIKDYGELVAASLTVLAPGGLLGGGVVDPQDLADRVRRHAGRGRDPRAGTTLTIIDRRGLPVDFPVAPGLRRGQLPQVRDRRARS